MKESADLRDYVNRRINELSLEELWSKEDGVLMMDIDPGAWREGHRKIVE
jgi:hypothetical protein